MIVLRRASRGILPLKKKSGIINLKLWTITMIRKYAVHHMGMSGNTIDNYAPQIHKHDPVRHRRASWEFPRHRCVYLLISRPYHLPGHKYRQR